MIPAAQITRLREAAQAATQPATILAILDELEEANESIDGYISTINGCVATINSLKARVIEVETMLDRERAENAALLAEREKLMAVARAAVEVQDACFDDIDYASWVKLCEALAALGDGAEPPVDGETRQVMPKVGGKPFRCDCGCNVFTNLTGSYDYTCNACGVVYSGKP